MGYVTWSAGGVRRFAPTSSTPGPAVVLAGQTPAAWLAASGQPRAFVDAGCWALCLDPADTDDIDDALAGAPSAASTIRVHLVAHGDAAPIALDWALDQFERVLSLSLLAPTGVTLSTPVGYVLSDLVGGTSPGGSRVHVWCEADDTDALALASTLGATTHTLTDADPALTAPAPVAEAAVATGAAWSHGDGSDTWARLISYVSALPSQTNPGRYRGGDGNFATPCDDTSTVVATWYADSFQTTVNADWTFDGITLVNSAVMLETGGAFTGQAYSSGTTGRALPDPGGSSWYWPLSGWWDGTNIRMLVGRVRNTETFVEVYERHLLTIDPADLLDGTVTVTATTTGIEDLLDAGDLLADGGFVYFHGDAQETIARAPAATVDDLDTWRFWDGARWTDDPDDLAPMVDTAGNRIDTGGLPGATRRTKAGFVRAQKPGLAPTINIWLAGEPQGPWTLVDTVDTPITGSDRYEGATVMFSYSLHWHPHRDTTDGMCLAWSSNYFASGSSPALTDQDFVWTLPQFGTVPVPDYR